MKNRTKGLLAIIVVLALVGLTACGNSSVSGGSIAMADGWNMPIQNAVVLPKDVKAGFDKVAGEDLVPVALVAQQVVSGTNDMILCRSGNEYRMIVIYRDLQGTATLTSNEPFLISYYTNGIRVLIQPPTGGWYVPNEMTSLPLPNDAKTALKNATKDFSGINIEPMALLGTQDIYYAYLCRMTPTGSSVSSVELFTVHIDSQKNASPRIYLPIDPEKYIK